METERDARQRSDEGGGLLLVRVASGVQALPLGSVREVLPLVEHRSVPGVPDWLLGVFNRRGTLLPLLDLGRLLGAGQTQRTRLNRIVVLDASGDGRLLGVVVDEVEDLESTVRDPAGEHPGFETGNGRHLGPIMMIRGRAVQLLRLDQVLSDEHRRILFARTQANGSEGSSP